MGDAGGAFKALRSKSLAIGRGLAGEAVEAPNELISASMSRPVDSPGEILYLLHWLLQCLQ
jgi:hypothetical protein